MNAKAMSLPVWDSRNAVIDPDTPAGQYHLMLVAERQRELEAGGLDRITAALATLSDRAAECAELNKAAKARSGVAKLQWLRRAAGTFGDSLDHANINACRAGCAHCCHVSVLVHEAEALVIAQETRRKLRHVPQAVHLGDLELEEIKQATNVQADRWCGTPCPFLQHGRCSIYSVRPLACRLHRTADRDHLLCKVVRGMDIDLPWVRHVEHDVALLDAFGHTPVADIREWFGPSGIVSTPPVPARS